MHTVEATLVLLALACAAGAGSRPVVQAAFHKAPPAKGGNRWYQGNRAPLLPSPLVKLPVGAVRPDGWLAGQLSRQADGFLGRLAEISPWCRFEGSAWSHPSGEGANGWEELPYWLKGQVSLGYVLDDPRIKAEATRWVNAMLSSQRSDGYFGPESNRSVPDLWPNMLALYALRTHYEATRDERVIPFMLRYFAWEHRLPLERFLPGSWQKVRGGDNLDVVHWLYNHTGQAWLLDLARVTHERTDDWSGKAASWHGVNMAQGFREPAQFFQQCKDERYLRAAERDYDELRERYGQVPGGLYGADENARPGYTGPRQAAETCAMVEMMYSHQVLASITGDARWLDRCEDVAFNSLPASFTPDLRGLHYLTAPNQVQLDRASKAPAIQNGGDMFSYNPRDYRCCQHNAAFGWPYYAEYAWMAAPGNGLAAALYAPCRVTARVGSAGVTATVVEETGYPFQEAVRFRVSVPRPVRFPLWLRIPGWCERPALRLNGEVVAVKTKAEGWVALTRAWQDGDTVTLDLPADIRATVWTRNRGTVSVSRGALTYSLLIGERWQRYGAADDRWPGFEVFPTMPWNYGLEIDPGNPAATVEVVRVAEVIPDQPFSPQTAPVALKARAHRIPEWVMEPNGLVGEVQPGPIRTSEPGEEVTLIPMGCARLRISAFPRVGSGPDAQVWGPAGPLLSASFQNGHDPLSALNDGVLPQNSHDQNLPRFTWWDHRGASEWVEFDLGEPVTLERSGVYWFDDEVTGGQCRVPAAWRLLYWDGAAWQPVKPKGAYPVLRDAWCPVQFEPVKTTRIRLEATLRQGYSSGILEWRVGV